MTEEQKEGLMMQLIHAHGYFHLREIPYRGICGLSYMAFTVGLFYGLDRTGYKGRYCFDNLREAMDAIDAWKGPGDPPGEWIKHKGHREYRNERVIIQKMCMETGVKPRVLAVRNIENGVMYSFGEGELLEDKVPDVEPFRTMGVTNPCIRLDNGKLVWGFQCWWAEKDEFMKQYKDKITEIETVEVPAGHEVAIYEPEKT